MKRVVILFLMVLMSANGLAVSGDAENNKGVRAERDGDYQTAVGWYTTSAIAGSPTGQYNLGRMFANGKATSDGTSDYKDAAWWYRKAAEQGHPTAQNNLGDCYEKGKGVEQDYELALKWYRKAAAQDSAAGHYSLGCCYENGIGVEQDIKEALYHYEKAMNLKDSRAKVAYERLSIGDNRVKKSGVHKNNLGRKYEQGIGVAQSDEKAVACYRESAAEGCPEGLYNLGRMYANGKATFWGHPDYEEALKLYRLAADQGLALAQNRLGECYQKGVGVELNFKEAISWFQQAAAQGYDLAYFNLGVCYENGYGCRVDYLQAKNYYSLGRESDYGDGRTKLWSTAAIMRINDKLRSDSHAQLTQGTRCEEKEDYEGALHWYRKAWEGNVLGAQSALHRLYEKGYGCETSDAEYVAWLITKANEVDLKKVALLAKMYEDGDGVVQDFEKAIAFYGQLAEQGDENAFSSLERLYERGYGRDTKNIGYVEWVKRRAQEGDCEQVVALAHMYEEGNGVPQDLNLAAHWFAIAVEQSVQDVKQPFERLLTMGYGRDVSSKAYRDWLQMQTEAQYGDFQIAVGDYFLQENRDVQEASEWYHRALELGAIRAKECLFALYEGCYFVDSSDVYVEWLNKKSEGGDKKYLLKLADVYEKTGDDAKLFECYQRLAQQGDSIALRQLADCYLHGKGVVANDSQALKYYRESVQLGDPIALSSLHALYAKGMWNDPSDAMYLKWLHKVARNQQNSDAQFKLAVLYETGTNVGQSMAEALKWYRKATQNGHRAARAALYKFFQAGYGEDIKDELYVEWLQDAKQDNMKLQFKLAQLFETGGKHIQRNLELAEKEYRLASQESSLSAACYYRLGEMSLLPERCDYQTALKWFKKGAALHHAASTKRVKDLAYIGPLTRWELARMNKVGLYYGYPTNLRTIQLRLCLYYGLPLLLIMGIMFFCKKGIERHDNR